MAVELWQRSCLLGCAFTYCQMVARSSSPVLFDLLSSSRFSSLLPPLSSLLSLPSPCRMIVRSFSSFDLRTNPGGSVRSYCKWLLHPAVQCTEECTHDLHLRIVDARAVQRSERPAVTDLRTAGGWGEQREMRRERREERGER